MAVTPPRHRVEYGRQYAGEILRTLYIGKGGLLGAHGLERTDSYKLSSDLYKQPNPIIINRRG